MKLYDAGRAPNTRRTRIFLAEKGLSLPLVPVDLLALEQNGEAYRRINPRGRVPALELDDGTIITESVAICRYFEELHPMPPLFGTGALGKAQVEMWNRRVELEFFNAVAAVYRHSRRSMAKMEVPQIPAWADANRPRVLEFLAFLDGHLRGRPYIVGADLTIADITAFVAVGMMDWANMAVPDHLDSLLDWHDRLAARPSASA